MIKNDEILSIIANELSNSDTCDDIENSLNYYLGKPNGTEVEGRSQVTSTDVADAIEWIMPEIMKSFTQNNEVVVFDPVHEGDERQAEMESEYVYEVLMKQNDGFIILHQFVKDALMTKNGILKCYYANVTKTKTIEHTGISQQQLQQILAVPSINILEKTEYIDEELTQQKQESIQQQIQMAQQQGQMDPMMIEAAQEEMSKPVMLYNVKLAIERTKGKIYVDPVAPEEFRFNSNHNSINLDEARFTAHIVGKTVSEIIEEFGTSKDIAKDYPGIDYPVGEFRFSAQDETVSSNDTEDESQKEIDIAECFLKIDIDGTGISKLMKITVAGSDNPTDILSMEEIDEMPWVATTAFLMSHKFKGLSITDRLIQIQDQKTALWRNMFDNMYLQNNQRNVVIENMVNMDDLLVSRPGGIIRAKGPNAVTPLPTPQLGADPYNMMKYLDQVRAGRTGVDPDGQVSPDNIGDRVGSQGVDRLMNAKEELVGLIIRVVAETGIKPLCVKIRDLSIKHVDAVIDFRFRGAWQKINPAKWEDRTMCTVRVGTGTGNHLAQVAALREVLILQDKIISNPLQTILDEKRIFNTLDDFCKFSGLNGSTRYFIDPDSKEGKENAEKVQQSQKEGQEKNDQIQQTMAQSQIKLAEAENGKAQAQMLSAQAKAETDQVKNELIAMKQIHESEMRQLEQQLDEAKAIADAEGVNATHDLKKYEIDQKTAVELTKIEAASLKEENANFEQNKETINNV